MQESYTFYVPPAFDGIEEMQRSYNQRLVRAAENARRAYLKLLETTNPASAYEEAARGIFELFVAELHV